MNKIDEIIERYANQILRENESRIRIQSKDVKALADLVNASANRITADVEKEKNTMWFRK